MVVQICQIPASTSEAVLRTHRVLIDRPTDKGGSDLDPMGGELFLAALGGSFMSNLLAAIKAREADVQGVRTQVTGTITDSPARCSAIEVCVYADSGSPDLRERLIEIAARGCIIMHTLRGTVELQTRVGVR